MPPGSPGRPAMLARHCPAYRPLVSSPAVPPHTFKVLPRRWVVERTLSWITRHRRTVCDYERLPARHETYTYWAMIIVMTRRLARHPQRQPA
jgi:transposase